MRGSQAANHGGSTAFLLRRGFAVWSMKKDPALELAISRNRRWIINNQIKNFLLRTSSPSPSGGFSACAAPVSALQKRFKTLDLRGRALNWLRKYPCCFDTFNGPNGEPYFSLSKRMLDLVDEEQSVLLSEEPAMASRLAKLLMLSRVKAPRDPAELRLPRRLPPPNPSFSPGDLPDLET